MSQLVITIVCAYLAFFIAESEMETSGVLTLVTAGIVVAGRAWPRFVSRESLETFWHALEFIGNTLIFLLAGVIFGGILSSRRHLISGRDVGYLMVLYVLSTLIR